MHQQSCFNSQSFYKYPKSSAKTNRDPVGVGSFKKMVLNCPTCPTQHLFKRQMSLHALRWTQRARYLRHHHLPALSQQLQQHQSRQNGDHRFFRLFLRHTCTKRRSRSLGHGGARTECTAKVSRTALMVSNMKSPLAVRP